MPDQPTAAAEAQEWPARAADTIVGLVDQVRDKTTGRAITASRWLVYGTIAGLLGFVALVVLTIALVRGLDLLLPDAWFGQQHVWAAYGIVGLLFVLVGLVLRRRMRPARG